MINTFISIFNTKYNCNYNSNNIMSGGQTNFSYIPLQLNVNRQSFQITGNNGFNYKFFEQVKWGTGNNMAIAIGMNPSQMLPSNLDKSNELLLYGCYLNLYDGYYLFNLYPLVQTQGFTKKWYNNISPTYGDLSDVIRSTLNTYANTFKITKYDVICFFGSSFYINTNIVNNLNNINSSNYFTLGTKTKLHKHPGRGVSINTIQINNRNSNTIRLTNGYYK